MWAFQSFSSEYRKLSHSTGHCAPSKRQTPEGKCLQLRKNKNSPIFSLLLKSKLLRWLGKSQSLLDYGTFILTLSQMLPFGVIASVEKEEWLSTYGIRWTRPHSRASVTIPAPEILGSGALNLNDLVNIVFTKMKRAWMPIFTEKCLRLKTNVSAFPVY